MNKNLTEVVIVMDKSGSMHPLIDDTIGGYNKFIQDQKEDAAKETKEGRRTVVLTTILFDTSYVTLHDRIDIEKVDLITKADYRPGGSTALLDAVGSTIENIGQKLSHTSESDRPGQVLFLIMTDGEENSSTSYTKEKVKEKIEHQRSVYQWEFVFLGADVHAFREARDIGIRYSVQWDKSDSEMAFQRTGEYVKHMKEGMSKFNEEVDEHLDLLLNPKKQQAD